MKNIKFGIIGCGMISVWHAKAITANADNGAVLAGVCDNNTGAAQKFAAE